MGSAGGWLGGAGAAAGGAASIAQFFQGKEASEDARRALEGEQERAARIIDMQSRHAENLIAQTGPLRTGVVAGLRGVLRGDRLGPYQIFAPEREMVESQFSRARENIIGSGQQGGQLNRSLSNLDIGRAQTLGGMEADVRRRAFEDALRVGFGIQPSVQFPGAGTGLALSQLANQQQASAGAGLGSVAGIGALLALKGQQPTRVQQA